MTETSEFLVKHGASFLFAAVFLDNIAIPFPAPLWLLAAGALSATGKFNPFLGIGITILACLPGDTFWFYLGRHPGNQVLGVFAEVFSVEVGVLFQQSARSQLSA